MKSPPAPNSFTKSPGILVNATPAPSPNTSTPSPMTPVPITSFGKDHWSLLAYLEATMADFPKQPLTGEVERDRLRCNPATHPLLFVGKRRFADMARWEPNYGTLLKDGTRLAAHDDWDCLDDLEAAGLCEVLSEINGFVRLTPLGHSLSLNLRTHKAKGGVFGNFNLPSDFPVPPTKAAPKRKKR